jgi:molybdate transport system ATP-binding protein
MSWSIDIRGKLGDLELNIQFESEATPILVIGPNGAGKSTLLRAIAGADLPIEGHIQLDGQALQDLAPHKRNVGYVPQGFALFDHMSVLDNVAFGCSEKNNAIAALEHFGAASLAERRPATLSGGEKQKVALARAWASDPRALLLDEPLSALDATTRRQMRGVLARHLQQAGRPSIVVTHDLRDARALQGTIVVLEEGHVVQIGSLSELSSNPCSDFVSEFMDVDGPAIEKVP